MTRLMALSAVLMLVCVPALAGVKTKMAASFEQFPAGTACGVEGAFLPVKQIQRDSGPRIILTGYASVGRVWCDLPDGRRVGFNINKRLPDKAKVAGFRVFPNGRATMTSRVEGEEMVTNQLTGVIEPWTP
ncbi:hypothetical protein [uncultured Roseobacter sp.]|uniref:hypothetical protein n=1 Tax=uncultured Roseobacter sp. TaxID=114847 RepID=UPI00261E820E|nr:hypothetical protein [uncultured Roseobacter sp.]